MASVLVHIEADGFQPTEASLRVLGEGRRIASTLGAALYAQVQLPSGDPATARRMADALGKAGADKVLATRGETAAGPPIWSSHGPALLRASELLRPLLVLLAADATGRELGPRLAAALGAAFAAEPVIERGSRGEVIFSRAVFGATYRRRLPADELDQPIVATLPAAGLAPAAGLGAALLRLLDDDDGGNVAVPDDASPDYTRSTEDPGAALEDARVLVVAGAGVTSFETYALVESLASALGGVVGATAALCAKGIAPSELQVGLGARQVAPALLVVCGASGSSALLGGVTTSPEIIAIDRDPDAPIFRVADYGIVGELEAVLPELIEAVRGHGGLAATS